MVEYGVDESVLTILREEALRETQARQSDAAQSDARSLEMQADLGLDAVPDAALTPAQKRAAMLRGDDLSPKPSARRDLLPDVEEINSTLRPSEQADDTDAPGGGMPDAARARNSFRSGFMMMMLIALIGLVAYLAAPRLAAQFPGLTEPLNAYVSFVDVIRLRLDGLMQSATVALKGEEG